MHGFVTIDKPIGMSSHDVVNRVRRILGTRKVGHTGTLDPFATGVLPVAVNEGTKAIQFLDEATKCYTATMRLGVTTDTLDLTGTVLSCSDPSHITAGALQEVLTRFTGSLLQVPPMYSALKRDGQPLYKLARQGIEVERQPRSVEIYALELLSWELPLVTFATRCSRGTYVRTLADDMGKQLGCGASLHQLRRTASGLFTIDKAVTLAQLEEAQLAGTVEKLCITPSAALGHLPEIALAASGLKKLSFGVAPLWDDTQLSEPLTMTSATLVRLTSNGNLAAVATLTPSADSSRFVLQRVFITPSA